MDNPEHAKNPIVQASSGIHITLPNYYSPRKMGLLDPATSDGRVIFFLPWQGNTIAGTTDTPAKVESDPQAPEEEIRWLLEEVRRYLSPDIKVRRGDVLSAWSGLRPLVRNPNAARTEGLVRNHMIHVSQSGLLTIAGGKWTTYRSMAEETVDKAVEVFKLQDRVKSGCVTESVRLVGSDGWSRNMYVGLIQRVRSPLLFSFPFFSLRNAMTYVHVCSTVWRRKLRNTCRTITATAHGRSAPSLIPQARSGLCTVSVFPPAIHVSSFPSYTSPPLPLPPCSSHTNVY